MSKLVKYAVCFVFLAGVGFSCKSTTETIGHDQENLTNRKHAGYLFDAVSETCAIEMYLYGYGVVTWQVPCTPAVIDKLGPSVREQAKAAMAKSLPPEQGNCVCPSRK